MVKTVYVLLLLALTAAVSAAPTTPKKAAATAPTAVMLYDGKAVGPSTLSVAAWGGGSGEESTETFIFGGHSLKVTTLDPYQGARITFATPVALSGDNRVLQFIVHRGSATLHYDPRTVGMPATAGPNGIIPGSFQDRMRQGSRRAAPTGPALSVTPLIPSITRLRLQLIFADGHQADVVRPISETADAAAGEGWYSVNVPVSILPSGGGTDLMLKSVTVGGDHFGTFFVGRMRLVTDTPTMTFTIDGPDRVLPGQAIVLKAKGDPGLSMVKYSWDLSADGGTDAPANNAVPLPAGFPIPSAVLAGSLTSDAVVTRFTDGTQDHTVTLTVTDADGLKKPVTVTKVIHVTRNRPGNSPAFGR